MREAQALQLEGRPPHSNQRKTHTAVKTQHGQNKQVKKIIIKNGTLKSGH